MSGRSDLGLPEDASVEDVKKRFRERAKIAHPDMGGNTNMFSRLKDAYDRAMREGSLSSTEKTCSWCSGQGYTVTHVFFRDIPFGVTCQFCGGTGKTQRAANVPATDLEFVAWNFRDIWIKINQVDPSIWKDMEEAWRKIAREEVDEEIAGKPEMKGTPEFYKQRKARKARRKKT